ncbi:MAG: sulfatase-like hydrolase/transferase [Planctomycetota bacterium]
MFRLNYAVAPAIAISSAAIAQPIVSWNMQSVQDVAEAGTGFPRGNPVVADLAPGGMFGGLLEDNPVFASLRGGIPLGAGDDLLWYFNPLTGHVFPNAGLGAPAHLYNPSSAFGLGDGISYDVSATFDPNLDPGVSGIVEGAFYPLDQYGNELELLGTHTHEFMFRSNGDTTDLNGDGRWTGNFAPTGGPSTNGFFVPAKDNQVIWWHDNPARLLLVANASAPGGLRMSFAGLDELGNDLFLSFDANARNYLNGEWVYVKLLYDAAAATVSGAQYLVEITTDTDPGPDVSLVTDRVVGHFAPSWGGLRPGQGTNPRVGLRVFGSTTDGRQFDGLIDAIQISNGSVSPAAMMGVTVPPSPESCGPVARWGMSPAFDTVTDHRDPNIVLNPGESGVQPVTLDRRTAPGEGDLLGGATHTATFPYGSREAIAQASPAADHLWCFTGENYDSDAFNGDFPTVALSAPFSLFAAGKAPSAVSSFDSAAFDAPATGSLVYPSDRYGDELAFQNSFTLEAIYLTSSVALQPLLVQGEARERYRLTVSGSGASFTLIDANAAAASATLDNSMVNHTGGIWVYTRATYDASTQSITIASRDELGNEDLITVSDLSGFGPLPTGSDGNMLVGRVPSDVTTGAQNFSGLIDEVQVTRGLLSSRDAMVLLSTDPTPPCSPRDIDGDGEITFFDVLALLEILETAPNCPEDCMCSTADLDDNGNADVFDLLYLIENLDAYNPNCGEAPRPNILVIFTDDQGYADFGSFGSTTHDTPRMDGLAAEGTRFTDFYAQSVCGPSRSALLTGRYPVRSRGWNMPPEEITWGELLQTAGYQTACIGKWDVSNRQEDIPRMPNAQGFDYFFGALGANDNGVIFYHQNNQSAGSSDDMSSITRLYTDKAIDYLTNMRDPARPFALYLSHTMPHTDIDASPQFLGQSDGGLYGDVIEEFDFETGRLLDTLDELGLTENTLVIYTTDNGPWNQDLYIDNETGHPPGSKFWGDSGPLREGKGSNYEGGVRAPCIIRWPGRVPAGVESDAVFTTLDLLPTFATLAGFDLPNDRIIDGVDQTNLILGRDPDGARETYVYTSQIPRVVANGIRRGKWKYLRPVHFVPGYAVINRAQVDELYDLEADIGETTNLAGQYPEIVNELKLELDRFWAEATRSGR